MARLDITRELAEFIVETRYQELSTETVHAAKTMILDTLGCGIAGFVLSKDEIAPVFKVIDDMGGKEECTLLVSGKRTSWFNAILGNGTAMHSIDYDGTRPGIATHIGSVVVPSVLALSEKLGTSGKDAILATVLGYEAASRIGSSVMPTHYDFWHSTGTNGTFGGAVAAGKLLGLNVDEMEKALGIAADQAAGLISCLEFGDLTKSLHAGLTSAKGALAATLAKFGATGPKGILEYARGYCNAYSKEPAMERIVQDLGKSFDILNDAIKFFPSALPSHSAIQATLRLVKENNILADSILRVVGKIETSAASRFTNYRPETALAARLSIPYCIAVAIIDKELRMGQFERTRLQDPMIKELMKKIEIEGDPALSGLYSDMIPAKVEIITKDGKTFVAEEYYPKGFPKNPMSDEEISSKFESLCAYVFEKRIIDQLRQMIMGMESLKDIFGMTKLLIKS